MVLIEGTIDSEGGEGEIGRDRFACLFCGVLQSYDKISGLCRCCIILAFTILSFSFTTSFLSVIALVWGLKLNSRTFVFCKARFNLSSSSNECHISLSVNLEEGYADTNQQERRF